MDGRGRIKLDGKDRDVNEGAGVYLEPSESATTQADDGALKRFVLVVPKIPKSKAPAWETKAPRILRGVFAEYLSRKIPASYRLPDDLAKC